MQNENIFVHFLKTNFCKNAITTATEEKIFQCASFEGVKKEPIFEMGFSCHQHHGKATECLSHRQKALLGMIDTFRTKINVKSTFCQKTFTEIYDILNPFKTRLRRCQTIADLSYMSEKIAREIGLNPHYNNDDKQHLELFIYCIKTLYEGDFHRSIQFSCCSDT